MEDRCIRCSAELTRDEVGLHKKLVNRGANRFLCKKCLSQYFEITEEQCDELIQKFKSAGCSLFH